MEPEYTAYQNSTHAKVPCVECHVGSGTNYLVRSKATGIPLVIATVLDTYDRPIRSPVDDLRPARSTCEHCHWPEKFTQDRVRVYERYAPDEENTREVTVQVFNMGGGAKAQGVHWHIASDLWYLPLDEGRQEIGWAQVRGSNGKITEYVNPSRKAELTPERIEGDKRFFDCIDCHNRATHDFKSPNELLNSAMTVAEIDPGLPFIKREGLRVLDPSTQSLDEARAKADALESFYRESYPEAGSYDPQKLEEAIETLKRLTELTVFPHMGVTWQTHLDNLSHSGCFRCHGVLVPSEGQDESEPIDASCTLCHYELAPDVAQVLLREGPVESAVAPFVSHSIGGREQCLGCHETGIAGATKVPKNHTGFNNDMCLVCHEAGTLPVEPPATPTVIPTPEPAPAPPAEATPTAVLPTQIPPPATATTRPANTPAPTVSPVSTTAPTGTPVPAKTPEPTPLPTPEPTATPVPVATPTETAPAFPTIPHSLEGRDACLLCHQTGVAGASKVPEDHAGRTNETCTACHKTE